MYINYRGMGQTILAADQFSTFEFKKKRNEVVSRQYEE